MSKYGPEKIPYLDTIQIVVCDIYFFVVCDIFLYGLTEKKFTQFLNELKPLSANHAKWSNTLKQFVSSLLTNCLSVFDHFVGTALQGLITFISI